MNRRQSREQAFLFVFEKTFKDETLEDILESAQLARDIDVSEFAQRVFNGISSNEKQINLLIEDNIKGWKKERLSRVASSLMQIAIYEMLYENDIPIGASINEAVELAKTYSTKEEASFINGVLGAVSKTMVLNNE